MPPDPARTAEIQAWLAKVAADLRAAEHDLLPIPHCSKTACFIANKPLRRRLKRS